MSKFTTIQVPFIEIGHLLYNPSNNYALIKKRYFYNYLEETCSGNFYQTYILQSEL